MNTDNKRQYAFTMAEVLLLMAVIGVIMALLVRAITRVDPDKDKFLFLKTYNAIETVVSSSINDPYKYDQNRYSSTELATIPSNQRHIDFTHDPLDTAKITYIDDGQKKQILPTQKNALCYYLAEQINTVGSVNCNTTDLNFRSSIGVCFYNWQTDANGLTQGEIDPSCSSAKKGNGYIINVYKRGNMFVPGGTGSDEAKERQNRAQHWLKQPTDLDDSHIGET